jgi:hypothetical protein
MMRRTALALFALAILAGCTTPLGPPVGVSVQAVEAARYQVTYRGTSHMAAAEVTDRALMQAAQLTLDHGYEWFQVAGRAVAGQPLPASPFDLGLGHPAGAKKGGQESFIASLEVVFGKGPRPRGPDAYDAHSVASTLGMRLH